MENELLGQFWEVGLVRFVGAEVFWVLLVGFGCYWLVVWLFDCLVCEG